MAVLENVDRWGPHARLVLGLVADGLQQRSECPSNLHSLVHAQRPEEGWGGGVGGGKQAALVRM